MTALIGCAAIVFAVYFQISKSGPIGKINPFSEDPYDAVGSFAFQLVLLVGALTYARALRFLFDPTRSANLRLILHGNLLALAAILVTLAVDEAAVMIHPLADSTWGNVLKLEIWAMFGLTVLGFLALFAVFWHLSIPEPPDDLTPADAIDDLWVLVRLPVGFACRKLPSGLVRWVENFNSDRLFVRLAWLDPRRHPWRFACVAGVGVGAGLVLAKLREGLPPSLSMGLLVAGIFILVECGMTLAGFVIFGKYLGLRRG